MKIEWDQFSGGANPAHYGRQIIRGLGIKQPPVDMNEVADFRGYRIMEASAEEVASYPQISRKIKELFAKACAHLFRKENLILIRAEQTRVKKRTDAAH